MCCPFGSLPPLVASPPSAPSGSEGHSSDNEVPPAKRTRMSREPPKDPGMVPKAGMSTPSQPPQTSPPTETDSAKRLRLFKSMTDRRFIAVLASDYAPPIAPASHGPNLSVEALMEMKSRQRYNALRMVCLQHPSICHNSTPQHHVGLSSRPLPAQWQLARGLVVDCQGYYH